MADKGPMRLLQLSLDPGESPALDLHPCFSVVQGLDERSRERVARTVAELCAGGTPPCPGVAEAHGVVLPIDEANLDLLDMRADVDPVVRRTDLPGAVPTPLDAVPGADAPGDGEASVPADDPVDELLRTAPEGLHPELDEARRHHRDTRDALAVLRDAADATARELEAAAAERRRLGDAISSAAVDGGEHAPGHQAEDVAQLEGDLAALDAGIAELAQLDVGSVRVLVEALEHPGPSEAQPLPEALAVADEMLRLHQEVAELEARMEAEGRGPGSALARLDAARAEAAEAEASLARPPVSSDDEEALRQAHEAVLDAERRASGLRSRSGQRKLAQALSVQQEILDRVGFPTWSAYVMGASLMGIDEGAKARVEAAELELAEAEAAWVEISAALEADPEHHALLDQLEEVEVRAIGLLLEHGATVPDEREDLESALRALRDPIRAPQPEDLTQALAQELLSLGLQVDPDDRERAMVTAQALLEECERVPQRLEELANERRRLEARLVEARDRAEARVWEELEAAVDRPASDRLAELEAALAAARAAEQDLSEALDARQALVDAATLAERAAARRARAAGQAVVERDVAVGEPDTGGELWSEIDAEAIEFYLLARLAALRQVSYAGSVPLVLVDAFRGVDEGSVRRVLDALVPMSETVQIVLISDDELVARWAEEQGPQRAGIVSVASVYA